MAGANGPTSAAGTVETPNPQGGAVEKPGVDPQRPERKEETGQDEAGQGQNEDG